MSFASNKRKVRLRNFIRRFRFLVDAPKPKMSDKQVAAISVIKRAIIKPQSKLAIIPESDIRTIECLDYYIEFGVHFATITNGKFSYDIHLEPEMSFELLKIFNRTVDKNYKSAKLKYDTKTLKSLNEMNTQLLK